MLLFLLAGQVSHAQNSKTDTGRSVKVIKDTTLRQTQGDRRDSTHKADTLKIKSSPSGLPSKVTYKADTTVFDLGSKKVYLYGNAHIEYQDIVLDAAQIEIDQSNSVLCAQGRLGDSGKLKGTPVFKQGNDILKTQKLCYNFRNKKGRTELGRTQEGDGFIHYEVAKTVKENGRDVIFGKQGWYTTCNLPDTPHFYIKTSKMKLIPKDKVITGPAYIVIEQIPLPLLLPFGFFPANARKSSGIIIPAVGESGTRGFALRNGGFYYGGSEHMDAALTGDIYTGGSYRVNLASNYAYRYHYGGQWSVSYANNQYGLKETPQYSVSRDFFFKWTHSMAAKARPNSRFSADVNVGSSKYLALNSYRPSDVFTQTLHSSIAYGTVFAGTPFSLDAAATHSQDLSKKRIDMDLPNVNFGVSRITPFKTATTVTRKWYTDLGFNYNAAFHNHLTTGDSTFRQSLDFRHFNSGITHSLPVSTSVRVLKYFTLTPSVSYNGWIYTKKISKHFDTTTIVKGTDTIHGRVVVDTTLGAYAAHEVSGSLGLSTKVYGMMKFRRGNIVAIRHVMTPGLNATYKPDFNEGLMQSVQTDRQGNRERYFMYESSAAGQPSFGKLGALGFSLQNNFEMKMKNKGDTVNPTKKVMLLDQLNFNSSYNFRADSFKLSPVSVLARTTLFKHLTLDAHGNFSPYYLNRDGRLLNQYDWDVRKRPARFTDGGMSLGLSLNPKARQAQPQQAPIAHETNALSAFYYPMQYADFSIPWNANIGFDFTYNRYAFINGRYKVQPTKVESVRFGGEMNVTFNWKITASTTFDLVKKDFATSSISIHRDLHCWEMSLDWIPFGPLRSYFFNIHIKASSLRDLKLEKRKEFYDY